MRFHLEYMTGREEADLFQRQLNRELTLSKDSKQTLSSDFSEVCLWNNP